MVSSGNKFFNSKINYVKVTDDKHEEKQEHAARDQDMCLTQQQYNTLLTLLWSKERVFEDAQTN